MLFWPTNTEVKYVVDGNAAGKTLHGGIYDMNNAVFKIGKEVKHITGNMTDFPEEIKKNINVDTMENLELKNISEIVASGTGQGQGQDDLAKVLKLLEKKDLNKYVFANSLISFIKN